MNPTRRYIISVASIIVAWVGFCFNSNLGSNCKADLVLMTVTIACVLIGVAQAIRTEPTDNSIKKVAPVAIAGCVGIAASYVGIFVV